MAVLVKVPYQKSFVSKHSPEETYDYFADLEKAIPGNFPGVEAFENKGPDTFKWVFEKVGYSGYELQIKLVTKFTKTRPTRIEVTPVAEPGGCLFTGGWKFTPEGSGTRIDFDAEFQIEIPVPGFLKGMATPLAQKELVKLFDRYIARVEKNFG
jgi:carbon monoxide dehydrogenase subunit G